MTQRSDNEVRWLVYNVLPVKQKKIFGSMWTTALVWVQTTSPIHFILVLLSFFFAFRFVSVLSGVRTQSDGNLSANSSCVHSYLANKADCDSD